jgi:parallel beta-helix repeat protein
MLLAVLTLSLCAVMGQTREIVITRDTTLDRNAVLNARLVIRASHVVIDGNGATLVGPGRAGNLASFENAGIGVCAGGVSNVILRHLKVKGFATGLAITDGRAWHVIGCDFSDNYDNPQFGWGELPPRGGIRLTRVRDSNFSKNRANRVWNGLDLIDSDHSMFGFNDFSHCSNVCAKLWTSSHNAFLKNNLSYGLRIDRAKGEVHARDSTGVLIESGSNDNMWYGNDITHGGDGLFIRVLNGWISTGNRFFENDTSYANNNCIESWSPGNTYIRNKANHGSYGFWLGGSDQTVLIENEAAYNGLPSGFHNAPEPVFGHGGIVIVKGPSSHTRIYGNRCHHNNGAGIAFRGDDATKGGAWRTYHWIVQNNDLHDNRWGIWGRWGDWIYLANNRFANNTEGNSLQDVTRLVQAKSDPAVRQAPMVELRGPERAKVGQPVRFDASRSRDPQGRRLTFHWDVGGPTLERLEKARDAGRGSRAEPRAYSERTPLKRAAGQSGAGDRRQSALPAPRWLHSLLEEPVVTPAFTQPGFYRIGVTVSNGVLAGLGFRDLLVVDGPAREYGTEGEAARWGFELEDNANGRGKIRFANDTDALCGQHSLRFTPDPYPGAYATAIYPASRNAGWDLSAKKQLSFWIKAQNPNLPGWQNPGPVIRLYGKNGVLTYTPSGGRNLLANPPYSEARWSWMRVVVPLAGSAEWERKETGTVTLGQINAMSLSLDSWGWEPFTVWVDGLTFE